MNIVKESRLGAGAYGDVYKVIDKNNDNHAVALKIMKNDSHNGDVRAATLREMNNTQLLVHPNIIAVDPLVYNNGSRNSVFINAAELRIELSIEMMNGDLNSLKPAELTRDVLRKMVHDVTNGLYHMHSMGYTHNDLKPDNILYKLDGGIYTFKIGDFGLSQYLGIPFPSNVVDFLCTATIKAPNSNYTSYKVEGNRYNYNSDMFSLGATMFWTCMRVHGVRWDNFKISEREVFVDIRKENFAEQIARLKEMYGEDGYDFLIKCMQFKSNLRMSSKQALEHPYLAPIRGGAISTLFTKISSLYNQPTLEDITGSTYELEFMDDMYNNYKDNTINLHIDYGRQIGNLTENINIQIYDWIYMTYKTPKFNILTFETYFQYLINYISVVNHIRELTTRNVQLASITVFGICNKLYSDFSDPHYITAEDYIWFGRGVFGLRGYIGEEIRILDGFNGKIPFTPIMFFLNYWYLKSIYTHEHKRPKLQILSTSVAFMIAIMISNKYELSSVKVDDIAKYCIKQSIRLQSHNDSANLEILNIPQILKDTLDNAIDEYMIRFSNAVFKDLSFFQDIKGIISGSSDFE